MAKEEYFCPQCGYTSTDPGICPTCHVALENFDVADYNDNKPHYTVEELHRAENLDENELPSDDFYDDKII